MTRQPPDPAAVAAGYDRAAAGYEDRHGGRIAKQRFGIIEKTIFDAARRGRAVLDLGCGTGRVLAQLAARVAVGVDISREMLVAARARGLAVARADAHRLPFADASFDAVVAAKGAFRYLDYDRALAECARVLRRGGRLAVHQYARRTWTLCGRADRPDGPEPADALHLDDPAELTRPAARAGFAVERVELWRAVRIPPYAVRVPAWPKNRLWNHCVVLFSRR